jgi:O-antigen/teichoic acid export membrane protein
MNIVRKKIARDTVQMFLASGFSGGLGVLRSFYIARFLSPAEFGIWSLMSSMLNYANYADLGVNNGLLVETGRLSGSNQRSLAEETLRQGFTVILLLAGLVAAVVLLGSALPEDFLDHELQWNLRIVAVGMIIMGVANYYQVVARLRHLFGVISCSVVITAAVALAGTWAVGTWFTQNRVSALMGASILGSLCAMALLAIAARAQPAWPIKRDRAVRLMKIGIPITMVPILFTIFQSIDRWVVAGIVSRQELGYYGFGAAMGLFLNMIPNTLAVVLFSRQIERFGATGDPLAAESLVIPPLFITAYVMALVGGAMILSIPMLTSYIVPAYTSANEVASIQVVGNCLLGVVPLASNFLISIQRQTRTLLWLLAATILEVVLVNGFARAYGITGAAVAVAISDLVYALALSYFALRLFRPNLRLCAKMMAGVFSPFLLCFALALSLRGMTDATGGRQFWTDATSWLQIMVQYLLIALPGCAVFGLISGVFTRYLPPWITGAKR